MTIEDFEEGFEPCYKCIYFHSVSKKPCKKCRVYTEDENMESYYDNGEYEEE